MAREFQVTIDCTDVPTLVAFWSAALGYVEESPPPGFDTWADALDAWGVPEERRDDRSALVHPDGSGPRLFLQRVPEGKTAKNRLHLDVRAAPGLRGDERMTTLEAEGDRLTALGAVRVRRFEPGEEFSGGHLVMQDPEGNEFCLD